MCGMWHVGGGRPALTSRVRMPHMSVVLFLGPFRAVLYTQAHGFVLRTARVYVLLERPCTPVRWHMGAPGGRRDRGPVRMGPLGRVWLRYRGVIGRAPRLEITDPKPPSAMTDGRAQIFDQKWGIPARGRRPRPTGASGR